MVINHLLTGMILQVWWSRGSLTCAAKVVAYGAACAAARHSWKDATQLLLEFGIQRRWMTPLTGGSFWEKLPIPKLEVSSVSSTSFFLKIDQRYSSTMLNIKMDQHGLFWRQLPHDLIVPAFWEYLNLFSGDIWTFLPFSNRRNVVHPVFDWRTLSKTHLFSCRSVTWSYGCQLVGPKGS